jgi:hypothetical protein
LTEIKGILGSQGITIEEETPVENGTRIKVNGATITVYSNGNAQV